MIKRFLGLNKSASSQVPSVEVGDRAVDFTLPATSDSKISLSDHFGQPVVLVFYPADESSVCTNQLALYNEALGLFDEYDAQILAISTDTLASHREFARSLKLRFPLLADSDPHGSVASAYGVLNEKDGLNERALFVIDKKGVVRWFEVSPRGNNPGADGILAALDELV